MENKKMASQIIKSLNAKSGGSGSGEVWEKVDIVSSEHEPNDSVLACTTEKQIYNKIIRVFVKINYTEDDTELFSIVALPPFANRVAMKYGAFTSSLESTGDGILYAFVSWEDKNILIVVHSEDSSQGFGIEVTKIEMLKE